MTENFDYHTGHMMLLRNILQYFATDSVKLLHTKV